MSLIEINKNPSRRDLLIFAIVLPGFFAVIGAHRWLVGSTDAARWLWVIGLALSACMIVPAARRVVYVVWIHATWPIAWTVSHVALALVWAVVVTPAGLLLRALGRDPLQRRFDENARSYWIVRRPNVDPARNLRQF